METENRFMGAIEDTLGGLNQLQYTENSALGYKTTDSALLDLNFQAASLRQAGEEEIVARFTKAYQENRLLAIKWLFFARDIRGGLGERRLFRVIINSLAQTHPGEAAKLIPLVPEYGRYDDLLPLLDTPCGEAVLAFFKEVLSADVKNREAGKPVSLLAKWLPSVNTSSEEARRMGRRIAKYLRLTERNYRKLLSGLRGYIDVVERKMTKSEWQQIKYERVPSRAALIYRHAFTRHDEERYNQYLLSVRKGETKINAGVLFPHDIVHQYGGGSWSEPVGEHDPALEALWDNLPNTVQTGDRILVVRDGSGSMTLTIGNTGVTALDCSTALAIYFAERMSGEFRNKFITFSRQPKLINLAGCTSLHDKLARSYQENDCSNTDIHAVFRLILKSVTENKLTQADMPTAILILSDMEFDGHWFVWDKSLFDAISAEYNAQGYKLPKLIFWNLNSRTRTVPLTQNELGVILISGFSPHLAKMVMSAQLDPYKALVEVLNSERYQPVDAIIG